jgi:hypothetical protein
LTRAPPTSPAASSLSPPASSSRSATNRRPRTAWPAPARSRRSRWGRTRVTGPSCSPSAWTTRSTSRPAGPAATP